MIDRPRNRAANAGVKCCAGAASVGRDKRENWEVLLFWRQNFFESNRSDGGIVGRNDHEIAGRDFGIASVERLRAPLLHIILKAPVALEPDRAGLSLESLPENFRSFTRSVCLPVIGRGDKQRHNSDREDAPVCYEKTLTSLSD